MGKRKPIENLVRIPSEGSGPVYLDGVGNEYRDVRDKFMAFLRQMFPVVALFESKLPPIQRDSRFSIPHVPNIGHFYPIGTMAPYVQMTPEQQESVNALYDEVGKAIRQAYSEGLRNGQNLLLQLAKGQVALSDFDQGVTVVTPKEDE